MMSCSSTYAVVMLCYLLQLSCWGCRAAVLVPPRMALDSWHYTWVGSDKARAQGRQTGKGKTSRLTDDGHQTHSKQWDVVKTSPMLENAGSQAKLPEGSQENDATTKQPLNQPQLGCKHSITPETEGSQVTKQGTEGHPTRATNASTCMRMH